MNKTIDSKGLTPLARYNKPQKSKCIIEKKSHSIEIGYSAYWYPKTSEVVFFGCWDDIPDWKQDTCPTKSQVIEYVKGFPKFYNTNTRT